MKKFFSFVAAAFVALSMNAADITCAAAVAAGNALADNVTDSTAMVSVVGYVSITEAWKSESKQQIFYVADDSASTSKDFEAYYCNTEVAIKRGDKVRVTGYLTKYVASSGFTQVEIKNGNVEILQSAQEEGPKEIKLYTVSEFIDAFDAGTLIEGDSCKVVGVIKKWYAKSSKFDTYHSVSYFITDGQKEFEMYNSYSVDNARFATYEYTDENTATCIDENGLELHIGDSVIGIGTAKKYGTTYEFNQNCYLLWTNASGSTTPVEQADVVFDKDDFTGKGTKDTGSEVEVTKDGVTFWCDKAYGDGQYGVRCYKNGKIRIASAEQQIGKIAFEFGLDKTGGLDKEVVVNGMEWEYTLSSEQARFNKISIYFGEYEKPVVEYDTITVAEAIDIAKALTPEKGKSAETDKKYAVKGFVVGISSTKTNTYYMADEAGAYGEFQAYQCANVDYTVAENDLVVVVGKIAHYYGEGASGEYHNYEISKGDLTHVYAEGIENIELTEKAQKVMVDGVMYIIRDNKMYNLQGTQVR